MITDNSIRLIVENCVDLKELFLGFTQITDTALGYLSSRPGIEIEIDQCQKCSLRRFGSFLSEEITLEEK